MFSANYKKYGTKIGRPGSIPETIQIPKILLWYSQKTTILLQQHVVRVLLKVLRNIVENLDQALAIR